MKRTLKQKIELFKRALELHAETYEQSHDRNKNNIFFQDDRVARAYRNSIEIFDSYFSPPKKKKNID